MPLEYIELEPIINEVLEKVRAELIQANRTGTLELALNRYGVDTVPQTYEENRRTGDTILVLGDLSISKVDLENLMKRFKLKEKSFEFVEYDNVTNFNFSKLIATQKYSDVFVGPVPHKAMDIGNASGVIEFLKNTEEIPAQITELRDSAGELKISKKTFKKALEESRLYNELYI